MEVAADARAAQKRMLRDGATEARMQAAEGSRIHILYAGGTIGCDGEKLSPMPAQAFEARLRTMHGFTGSNEVVFPRRGVRAEEHVAFDLEAVTPPMDSANLSPSDWYRLADRILEARQRYDYDGYVVLHGTDTMAYSASALSFILNGFDRPIVMTGSQLPLVDTRSDALRNLVTAILVASRNIEFYELGVCFGSLFVRGNRCTKVSSWGFDAFDSPRYPRLAEIGSEVRFNLPILRREPWPRGSLPSREALVATAQRVTSNKVEVVRLYPGVSASIVTGLLRSQSLKGLVIETFGSGTVPADRGLIDALREATDAGVVVAACAQVHDGRVIGGTYEAGEPLTEAGAVLAGSMTTEACVTKLTHMLASRTEDGTEAVRLDFPSDLCGEYADPAPPSAKKTSSDAGS